MRWIPLSLALTTIVGTVTTTAAEDAPAGEAVAPAEEVSPWTFGVNLGAFVSSVAAGNADDSRDPTIGGTNESISYEGSVEANLDWVDGSESVEQDLVLKYGRLKEEDQAWSEKVDQIDYDGAYKHSWPDHHFWYGAWGGDSVFTGVEPEEEPLDPFIGKVSAGYGQIYKHVEPHERSFEWRVGVRGQKTWGRDLSEREREFEIGPEAYARYEAKHTEQLSYWAQYEAFGEFDDLGHITNLFTAGLTFKFNEAIALKLGLRAYYETEPDDLEAGESDAGFGEISWVQDTLLGVTYTY